MIGVGPEHRALGQAKMRVREVWNSWRCGGFFGNKGTARYNVPGAGR